jgi:tripartite-type tricarboxylate transporter receptor subunit TctC
MIPNQLALLTVSLALSCIPLAAAQPAAKSEAWPTRPVRLVVPFAAGGATDVVIRIVAGKVGEQTSATFVIDNRTGGGGNIGTEIVKNATPDGYTFLVGSPGTLVINPHLFRSLPYDALKDFVPVVHVARFPQVLAVNASIPAKTTAELIALAKLQPNKLNYGSSGTGSTGHLITASFLQQAGIQVTHVPFRGGALAVQALLAGEVQMVIDGLPSFTAHLQAGRIRVLAVTASDRWPGLPDVPTISESAVPGFDLSSWTLLAAPIGTPPTIVARLAHEINTALKNEEVRARLQQVGATPAGGTPGVAFKFHRAEYEKWKRVVQVSGAKVE